jgi:hypothetical protein
VIVDFAFPNRRFLRSIAIKFCAEQKLYVKDDRGNTWAFVRQALKLHRLFTTGFRAISRTTQLNFRYVTWFWFAARTACAISYWCWHDQVANVSCLHHGVRVAQLHSSVISSSFAYRSNQITPVELRQTQRTRGRKKLTNILAIYVWNFRLCKFNLEH